MRDGWILVFLLIYNLCYSQQNETENVVVIMLDGYRWQEVFNGADSTLLFDNKVTPDPEVRNQFWRSDLHQRREALMPFFWSVINKQGQLIGDRDNGSKMDCDNPFWFSYPGYSEAITGFVDRKVRSNAYVENPNVTVLEFAGRQPEFKGSVAAFATWNLFPAILREGKSGIYINAGLDTALTAITPVEQALNSTQKLLTHPVSNRFDTFTFAYATEHMKKTHSRVTFISLDETDSYAHHGQYDNYLLAANRADRMIGELWSFIQSDSVYRNKTNIIITTDHGRGRKAHGKHGSWQCHGRLALGSGQVWLAAIGPNVISDAAVSKGKFKLSQVAATIADILGFTYTNVQKVSNALPIIKRREYIDRTDSISSIVE